MKKMLMAILVLGFISCARDSQKNVNKNTFHTTIWSGNHEYTIDFTHSITDSTRNYNFVIYRIINNNLINKLNREEKMNDSLFKYEGKFYADTTIHMDINKDARLIRNIKVTTKIKDTYFNKYFYPDTSFKWDYKDKNVIFSPLGITIDLK